MSKRNHSPLYRCELCGALFARPTVECVSLGEAKVKVLLTTTTDEATTTHVCNKEDPANSNIGLAKFVGFSAPRT